MHPVAKGQCLVDRWALLFLSGLFYWTACFDAVAEASFNGDIRPIFAEHCFHCHGPDASQRKGRLRLDLESGAKKSVIIEGSAELSPLMERLHTDDPDERMPPPEHGAGLSTLEIQMIQQWINEGARYEKHWSFEPILMAEPPDLGDPKLSAMDRFVIDKLQQRGLNMAPAVSPAHWIRRVSFDLIGLPPTWEEVTSFVSDTSPDARNKVVDRLLDSPRYGERWARHWLDIARYADTHGGSAIGFTRFPFSYTYRDYVIRAFNQDISYDRFLLEQIAADQLGLPENDPALAGLGFLTIGQQFRTRHDIIDDQIDVITRGLMGLTVACARCHDHKFDRISTKDYYALYATLASSQSPELLPLTGRPEPTEQYVTYKRRLFDLQQEYEDMAREQSEVMRGRLRMQVGAYLKALARGVPEQDLSVSFLSFRTDDLRPHVLERWRHYLKDMDPDDPVFGPWKQFSLLPEVSFGEKVLGKVAIWRETNGDLSKTTPQQDLGASTPRWNPLVIEALEKARPESMEAVAGIYGGLFSDAHRQWFEKRTQASEEALPGVLPIPDQDKRHRNINSAVLRQLRRHLYAPGTPTALSDKEASRLLNRTVSDKLAGRRSAIHDLHLNATGSPPRSMVLFEDASGAGEPHHVFLRGSPMNKGEQVHPRFLNALVHEGPEIFPAGRRRLGLAQAIVKPSNPLTSRVLVNWVWRHHFGRGLVRSPDDFGVRGETPTHPALLDYLAKAFHDGGGSIKELHRLIVLSRTYAQSSRESHDARAKDPYNHLLWRMPRSRLSLEAMRDAMLQASGELDFSMGGRPFDMDAQPVISRRSVYGFVNRDVPSVLLTTFDGANPSACTARRPETSVPQQTLFALNSDFIQDRAAAMAQAAVTMFASSDEGKVRYLYRSAYARLPDNDETEVSLQHVRHWTTISDKDPWLQLAHALLASNEFMFVD
jgi:hypothetical protein